MNVTRRREINPSPTPNSYPPTPAHRALPARLTRRAARERRATHDRLLEPARFRAGLWRFTARLAFLRHTILLCATRPARSSETPDPAPSAHSQARPAKKNQKAVSGCASLTARVSHVWESYPGDTPTASVIITIIRMRTIAAEQFMIMVSRRLVIEKASSNWFC